MSQHLCHAKGCIMPCPPEKLMCTSCWKKVSSPTKHWVYQEYTPGQCKDKSLITARWFKAVRQAIKEVAAK